MIGAADPPASSGQIASAARQPLKNTRSRNVIPQDYTRPKGCLRLGGLSRRLGVPMFPRRTFLKGLSASLAGARAQRSRDAEAEPGRPFRIWDDHCHLGSVPGDTPEERMTALVRWADRLGIERLLLSQGYSAQLHPTPEQFREEN